MKHWLKRNLSIRQFEILRLISYELKRLKCRILSPAKYKTSLSRLHIGSGDRKITGWLNVDLVDSDLNLDIAKGRLPFADQQFEVIVSQHVIEHLTIEDELIPLLKECFRTLKPGGELWLSTPDMEKVAKSYLDHKSEDMIADRQTRKPEWNLNGLPSQHFMNDIFHQQLEHRNLFDFGLLKWTLEQAGFLNVTPSSESELLTVFGGFPARNDDYQSLYIKAVRS
ncbi:MAG TPA: methyltransferase domain-containing protein [Chryseolinea sp.]|nr:methyltransferase domain-containing protein [Chryseolinea sp.]